MSDFTAFGNMERAGWSDATRASGYIELFASPSDQAIESLLDAVGAKPNVKALDLRRTTMQYQESSIPTASGQAPWNKGKLIGASRRLRLGERDPAHINGSPSAMVK